MSLSLPSLFLFVPASLDGDTADDSMMDGVIKCGVMGDGVKAGDFTVGNIIGDSVKTGNIASNEQWNCVSVLSEDVYNCNILLLIL